MIFDNAKGFDLRSQGACCILYYRNGLCASATLCVVSSNTCSSCDVRHGKEDIENQYSDDEPEVEL